MLETKCERQAERLGFMAEDVRSLIQLAEQVHQDLKDEAVWGKHNDPEQLTREIREVQITISALKSCLAAINNARLAEESAGRFDFTDEQCMLCPKFRSAELQEQEGEHSWDAGRYWRCGDCGTRLEIRQIAREVGACQ